MNNEHFVSCISLKPKRIRIFARFEKVIRLSIGSQMFSCVNLDSEFYFQIKHCWLWVCYTRTQRRREHKKNTGGFNKSWAVKLLQATCQMCSSCKISVTENILRSLYNLVSFECQLIQWSTCAYFKRRELVKLTCFCRDACFELALPQVCGRVDWVVWEGALLPSGTEQFPSCSLPCL